MTKAGKVLLTAQTHHSLANHLVSLGLVTTISGASRTACISANLSAFFASSGKLSTWLEVSQTLSSLHCAHLQHTQPLVATDDSDNEHRVH